MITNKTALTAENLLTNLRDQIVLTADKSALTNLVEATRQAGGMDADEESLEALAKACSASPAFMSTAVMDGSHKFFTTFNPFDHRTGGCGHTHTNYGSALRCVERSRDEHGHQRMVVGFTHRGQITDEQRWPLGTDLEELVNPDPQEVLAEAQQQAEQGPPDFIDNKIRFGKHKGKTWRDVVDSKEGREYLEWAQQNAMKRSSPNYKSPGEYAAPLLEWHKNGQPQGSGQGQQGQQPPPHPDSMPKTTAQKLADGMEQDAQEAAQQKQDAPLPKKGKPQPQHEQGKHDGLVTDPSKASDSDASETVDELKKIAKDAAEDLVKRCISESVSASKPVAQDEAQKKTEATLEQVLPTMVRDQLDAMAPKKLLVQTPENPEGVELDAQHPKFEVLLKMIAAGNNRVWMSGPAGSGKTTAAEKVAACLSRELFILTPVADKFEVFGYNDAKGDYVPTEVHAWVKADPGAILLIDEIDGCMPQPLVAANALTAPGGWGVFPDGTKVKIPDDHVIIATANTWGSGATADYVGRAPIDAATKNRFPTKIDWGYDEAFELKLATQVPGGTPVRVRACQSIRKNLETHKIKVVWSPRDVMAYCRTREAGFSHDEAIALSSLAELKPDMLKKAMLNVTAPE